VTDRLSVANLALVKMGASDTIVAPDQDSHAARTIASVWDDVRRACIRGGRKAPRWNFAEEYAETPARAISAGKPLPFGWSGAFPAPDGALRLAEIVDPVTSDDGWKFASGEVLLRGSGPLRAWWLFDVPEVALWDALFVQCFAARLAYETVDRIAADLARKSALWNEYEANLSAATKVDARENPPVEPEESSWVAARGAGSGAGWYANGSWPGRGWNAGPK